MVGCNDNRFHQGTATGLSSRPDASMIGKCARRWKWTMTWVWVISMSAGISMRSRKICRAWASLIAAHATSEQAIETAGDYQ